MVSHWNLSDRKSLHVSRIFRDILDNLYYNAVWMVCSWTLISKYSSSCTNTLGIVSSALIIIGITVAFMFQRYFCSQAKSWYLSLFSLSFNLVSGLLKRQSSLMSKFSFLLLLLNITWSGLLTEIWWSICISKALKILCVSLSRRDSWLCIYH